MKYDTVIPENNRIARRHYSNIQVYLLFNVVTKQIILLNTYQIINLVNWICLRCTITVSHAHLTFKCYNLIPKVVFLFQSFLVITICQCNLMNSK